MAAPAWLRNQGERGPLSPFPLASASLEVGEGMGGRDYRRCKIKKGGNGNKRWVIIMSGEDPVNRIGNNAQKELKGDGMFLNKI